MYERDSSKSNRAQLRSHLTESYEELVTQLTWRLGSRDFAREALHETFLRLEKVTDSAPIRSPKDYIFRVAVNVAKDRQKANNYRVSAAEIDALLDVGDEAPSPEQITAARSEIEAFKRALSELPPRLREVVRAVLVDGVAPRDVANRLQVSLRTVESDLKRALKHCADFLGRDLTERRGGPRARC